MNPTRSDLRLLPEAALVLSAQAGDRAAFTELVRRREGWLRALLRRLCANTAEADDLAQDTFLRAWRKLSSLDKPAAFGGWLRQLAVRRFIDARRLARTDMDSDADTSVIASDDVAPDRTAGARIDLERALILLSPSERLCITLNLGEGLSHGEVAQLTALPLGTVKSHIQRGLAKLRHVLGDADE